MKKVSVIESNLDCKHTRNVALLHARPKEKCSSLLWPTIKCASSSDSARRTLSPLIDEKSYEGGNSSVSLVQIGNVVKTNLRCIQREDPFIFLDGRPDLQDHCKLMCSSRALLEISWLNLDSFEESHSINVVYAMMNYLRR